MSSSAPELSDGLNGLLVLRFDEGVANHTDFLRAIGSGTVTATAKPIHRG